jgi:hypothetical protein
MAKVQKTPAQMQSKWVNGMGAAGQTWSQAIQATQKNPMALAVTPAATAKAVQNYTRVIQSPAFQQRMAAMNPAAWKQACSNAAQQGAFTRGASKGQAAYLKFAQNAQPIYADMRRVADLAAGNWQQQVIQSISLLIAAGRKNGNGSLVGK